MSAPTEEAEQVEETPVAPVARHHTEEAEAPAAQGTPYGQIALGLVSVLTLASLGLYNALGPLGLAAGGAAATAGAAGYGAHRYRLAHPRKEQNSRSAHERKTRSGRDSHGGRAGKASSLFSGASRSGRGAVFSAGGGRKSAGTSSRIPTLGRAARAASALGKHSAPGGSGGKRMKFAGHKGGTGRKSGRGKLGHEKRKGHKNSQPRRAAQVASTPLRIAGRAVRARVAPRIARARAASRRLDERTGRVASRAARRLARGSRAAGGWVDRRTGARVSTAWAAARTGGRRAAVTALTGRFRRWDAQTTAALVGLVAWMARPFLRHGEAEKTPTDAPTATAQQAQKHQSATERPPHPHANLPTRPALSHHAHRGAPMSFGLITHATELPTIASSYASDDMMEVKAHLELLRELPLQAAASIRIFTDRLGADYPLSPQVVEAMQRVYEALCTAVPPAEEVAGVFASAHADDIARRLQPRTNERLWNA